MFHKNIPLEVLDKAVGVGNFIKYNSFSAVF